MEACGCLRFTSCPMACIRCVLPMPTPPYRNNGIYALVGRSATACDAAFANWFPAPMTNALNVYLGLSCAAESQSKRCCLDDEGADAPLAETGAKPPSARAGGTVGSSSAVTNLTS